MSLLLSILLVIALTLAGALALRRALRRAQAALGTVWLGHGCEQLTEPAPPESLACVIVRWHHVHSPDLWVAVGLAELGQFMLADAIVRDWDNPVWSRAVLFGFQPLVEDGFVAGWVNGDPDSRGLITDKFLAAIAGSYWDRSGHAEAAP